MLLIYNLIIGEKPKQYFDDVIANRITSNLNIQYEILHLEGQIPKLDNFTHLLLTGSELSASKKNENDDYINFIISHFVNNNKAILGICYGHQMLVKFLEGNQKCRKAEFPEIGWRNISIESNFLFSMIKNPIAICSHYDEVFDLSSDFKIIASTNKCQIQAIQYKNFPIWGIQFHPEMQFSDGSKMISKHLEKFPEDNKFYFNEISNESEVLQNQKIFDNFFNTKAGKKY